MKRVLSLLLLIPFLSVQALAGLGGPFDDAYAYSQTGWAGTYGISLQGTEDAGLDSLSTIGVMTLSVPPSQLAMGRVLIFDKGMMYIGSAMGQPDPRKKQLKLMAQASHYSIFNQLNQTLVPVVDYILSGQLNLALSMDNLSGLVVLKGDAVFARYDPVAEALTVRQGTSTEAINNIDGTTLTKTDGTNSTTLNSSLGANTVASTGNQSTTNLQLDQVQNQGVIGSTSSSGSTGQSLTSATNTTNNGANSSDSKGTNTSATATVNDGMNASSNLVKIGTVSKNTNSGNTSSSTASSSSTDIASSTASVNGADSDLTGTSGNVTTTQTSTPGGTSVVNTNVAQINELDGSVTTVTTTSNSGNTGPDTVSTKSTNSSQSVSSTGQKVVSSTTGATSGGSDNATTTSDSTDSTGSTKSNANTSQSGTTGTTLNTATAANTASTTANNQNGTTQASTKTDSTNSTTSGLTGTLVSNTQGGTTSDSKTVNNNATVNNTAAANQAKNATATNTNTSTQTSSTVYSDPDQIHHTTPVPKVATVAGSDKITVDSSSSLRVGMTLNGPGIENGTTIIKIDGKTVQLSKPAIATASSVKLSADASSVIFLTMTADGYREDTTVVALTPIVAPSAASGYQIGMSQTLPGGATVAPTGGNAGGGAAAGAGAGAGAGGGAGA